MRSIPALREQARHWAWQRIVAALVLASAFILILVGGPTLATRAKPSDWRGIHLDPISLGDRAPSSAGDDSRFAEADPAPIAVTLLGNLVDWRTTPKTSVRGRVLIGGEEAAIAYASSDSAGFVQLAFYGTGGGIPIASGASIELLPDGAETPFIFDVPVLAADVDAAADRIVGQAPPSSELRLIVRDESGEPIVDRGLRAAPDGTLDVSLVGEADIVPGQVGSLEYVDAHGNRFDARFAALRLDVQLGDRTILARATLGTTVTATIKRADGSLKGTMSGRVAPWYTPIVPNDVTLTGAMTEPILAGDTISIARSGGLLDSGISDRTVPDLAVRIDPSARRIVGTGPPSTTLSLVAMGPLEELLRTEVETNIGGAFESAVSEKIGAGWRVELSYDDGVGLRSAALGLEPQVVASVHGSVVYGVNTPGHPVRVSLRGPTGTLSDTWSVSTLADGAFRVVLAARGTGSGSNSRSVPGSGSGFVSGAGASSGLGSGSSSSGESRSYWRIRPGDVLEVDLADGDPIVMPVPLLGARTDPETEIVSGMAAPGADLHFVVESDVDAAEGGIEAGLPRSSTGRSIIARSSQRAAADGAFAFDVGGLSGPDGMPLDIEFPMSGRVRASRPDGHAFEAGWAPIVVRLTMGEESFIQGTGAPGRDVSIVLTGSDGRRIASLGERDESTVYNAEPYWFADLRDALGLHVPILGGDVLTIRVGDDEAVLNVPSLDGVVHVTDDLVSGTGGPGMNIVARIFGLDGSSAVVAGDTFDDGSFLVDFGAADFDVRFNSSVTLSTSVGRHSVTRPIDGPGLSIDLVQGTVAGSAEPGSNVELELIRGAGPIARHEFVAPRGGAFAVAFERGIGERLVPLEGDVLIMRLDDGPTIDREIRLEVPALTIEHDSDADIVWGRVTPEGRLEIWAELVVPREDEGAWAGEARVEVGGDGRYTVAFENEAFDIRPGTAFFGWLQLPSGHFVTTRRIVPMINAQMGAGTACGWANLPRSGVSVAVDRAEGGASERGLGITRSALDASFSTTVSTGEGRSFAMRSGDRLSADLAGVEVDFRLPPLEIEIDSEEDLLRVTTTPGTDVIISWPFGVCGEDLVEHAWDGGTLVSDTDGKVEMPLSTLLPPLTGPDALPGAVIEVAIFEPGGHRLFVPIRPLTLEVHIGTPRVTGWAMSGSAVSLRLIAPDGTERGTAATDIGDDGRLDALLIDHAGELVASHPGDSLEIAAPGMAPSSSLVLEPLDFDFDAGTGLIGVTTPGRRVQATMRLSKIGAIPEAEVDFELLADAGGQFSLTAPPARSEWTLADVVEIRLSIMVGEGHRIISTFTRRPVFGPGSPAYLPIVWNGR